MPEKDCSWLLFFCSICDEMLGVEDHLRIQHEHFEVRNRCRGGRYRVVEVAPTGIEGAWAEVYEARQERSERAALAKSEPRASEDRP